MAGQTRKRQKKPRALLLYMAGDNDLSEAGMRDIAELCREGSSDELWVGVEIDTHGVHEGSIRYEITEKQTQPRGPDKAFRMVIDRLVERDSGKPETLLDFLRWGKLRFPAKELFVVIGGHGSGFRRKNRSLAADFHGSAIDMDELANVFRLAKLTGENRLGLLGFDACLMSLLEVAHHISPYAYVMAGSQEVEPGDGWPYDSVLVHLKGKGDLVSVASEIAKSYVGHYTTQKILNVTQSVILLDHTESAMLSLSDLGNSLVDALDKDSTGDVYSQLLSTRTNIQSFRDSEYVDLIHMTELLSESDLAPAVTAAARALMNSARTAIICSRVPGRSMRLKNANGLSIWFPAERFSHVVHRQKYLELSGVSKFNGWLKFLDRFFADSPKL